MPQIEFRLKTLLTLRHCEREHRRAELAAACAQESQLAGRKASLDAELECQRHWVRAATTPGSIVAERLHGAAGYERSLRAQLAQIVASQQTATAEVGRCQQALTAAESEVRVLEKLRDRQLDEFTTRRNRLEARQLDEAAARAHRR